MHPAVQALSAHLPALDKQLGGWNDEDTIGMPRPPVKLHKRNFYGDKEWQQKVKNTLTRHFGRSVTPRPPLVTTAPIASSDRLVKDTELVKTWLKVARHMRAVEMELAGVYRAARRREREYPILAIRGISDIVGFKRHPDWTSYACHSAAAFAHALIKAKSMGFNVRRGSGEHGGNLSVSGIEDELMNERQKRAVAYVRRYGKITHHEYRQLTGISDKAARWDLAMMREQGIIQAFGKGRSTAYTLGKRRDDGD